MSLPEPSVSSSNRSDGNRRLVTATAGLAAAGAVTCGVCCVLPFALPAALLAMAGGALSWIAGLQPWITAAGVVAVLGAWSWVGFQSLKTGKPPSRATLLTMVLAAALLAAAVLWPRIEPLILGSLGLR